MLAAQIVVQQHGVRDLCTSDLTGDNNLPTSSRYYSQLRCGSQQRRCHYPWMVRSYARVHPAAPKQKSLTMQLVGITPQHYQRLLTSLDTHNLRPRPDLYPSIIIAFTA